MKIIKKLLLIFGITLFFQAIPGNTLAEYEYNDYLETPCSQASYSALIQLPEGDYNIYLQAGRSEDKGDTKVYFQELESEDCDIVGQGKIATRNYSLVGSLSKTDDSSMGTVFVVGSGNDDDISAGPSTPLVIFSDKATQPCDPTSGCVVDYKKQKFVLYPKKISMNIDTVRVGLLMPYTLDYKEIIYSVDDRPAYIKNILEEFNTNYVPDGEHVLSRTIVLKDGQALSDSKTIKRGLNGGFTYFFVSILYGQSVLVKSLLVLIVGGVLFSLVLWVVRRFKQKKQWYKSHFATTPDHVDMSKAGFQTNFSNEESTKDLLFRHKRLLVSVLSGLALLLFTGSFVISIFTVDGVSMYPTLQDRSKRLLLILPVSVGRLNKNYYIPSRGTIVVVQKDDNNLFNEGAKKEKQFVVKRVIGLPGERVVIKNGKILVYNKENIKGFEPDAVYKWIKDLTGSEGVNVDVTLRDGELFVVGDNRDESVDSRLYGPIKTSEIIGKVL